MQASKLITVSTLAVLLGGTSLAIGQEAAGALKGDSSTYGSSSISKGSARGSEMGGSSQQAGEKAMRRSEASGERGSNVQRSRGSQRSQAMTAERDQAVGGARAQATTAERGRAIAGERGPAKSAERGRAIGGERGLASSGERARAMAGERGRAMTDERRQATNGQEAKAAAQTPRQLGSHSRQSFGQEEAPGRVYARANERTAGAGLSAEQRARVREILSARRDIPRVSNLSDVRINAVIPRNVRMAAIPEEVVRIYPRFRQHQAFIYRNEIVVVDPLTSRIVAVLPA
jgi:hypothetical protein